MDKNFVSVVTATYNREKYLSRVYESLKKQTFKFFEWIIIDDGSSDNTKDLVNDWILENIIDIKYIYQTNQGKHVAINNGVQQARGFWVAVMDSDDSFKDNYLEFLISKYEEIDDDRKKLFLGVSARCFAENNIDVLGTKFPKKVYIFDATENELRYKYRVTGELCGITKREALLKYPSPTIKGLRYYPESIIWDEMSKEYLTRFVDEPMRYYYRDAYNGLTNSKSYTRFKENYYLWLHNVNNNTKYFFKVPKTILKSFVGLSMDSFFCKINTSTTMKKINNPFKKVVYFFLIPLGFILYLIKRRK